MIGDYLHIRINFGNSRDGMCTELSHEDLASILNPGGAENDCSCMSMTTVNVGDVLQDYAEYWRRRN